MRVVNWQWNAVKEEFIIDFTKIYYVYKTLLHIS